METNSNKGQRGDLEGGKPPGRGQSVGGEGGEKIFFLYNFFFLCDFSFENERVGKRETFKVLRFWF